MRFGQCLKGRCARASNVGRGYCQDRRNSSICVAKVIFVCGLWRSDSSVPVGHRLGKFYASSREHVSRHGECEFMLAKKHHTHVFLRQKVGLFLAPEGKARFLGLLPCLGTWTEGTPPPLNEARA